MIQLADIHALTDFLRNHKQHIERLRRKRRPEVLTINGKAAIVVQDAASYQRLLDQIERAQTLEGIRKGLADMQAGKGRPAAAFFDELERKHRIGKKR